MRRRLAAPHRGGPDAGDRGPAWRHLPAHITFTTRLAANAVLYGPKPPRTGRRGHPAWKGQRLGSAAAIAAAATWRRTRVTRYGTTETVDLAVITCRWWGSPHRTPVRVVSVRDLDETKPYTLALATTDLTTRRADRGQVRLPLVRSPGHTTGIRITAAVSLPTCEAFALLNATEAF